MEPNPYEAVEGRALRAKPRRNGFLAALAGGLMVVGAASLGLIGVMVFRTNLPPADEEARSPAVAAQPPAQASSAAAIAATPRPPSAADVAARAAADKALAESLVRRVTLEPAPAAPPAGVVVIPAQPTPVAAAPAPQVAALPPAAAPRPASASPAEIRSHVARASAMFREGDVAGARLLLDRTVRSGDAGAAFALAETYDPGILASLNVRGVRGDAARARDLYKLALDGGISEARARIAGLGQ